MRPKVLTIPSSSIAGVDAISAAATDTFTHWVGGDEGTRTPDPRDANAVLFQLSYIPTGDGL